MERDPRLAHVDALADGTPSGEQAWYAAMRDLLETAYAAGSDAAAQSGKSGGLESWERARRVIAEAFDRDGTFVDIGCANGLLMESVVAWAVAGGWRIEPYGLDLSKRLVELARQRLPQWAGRVAVGNAMTWWPPRRFDFVRTELVYAPPRREADLVRHLLEEVVASDGRLVVCAYGRSDGQPPRAQPLRPVLEGWGHAVHGEVEARAGTGVVVTRVAWVDGAKRAARMARHSDVR